MGTEGLYTGDCFISCLLTWNRHRVVGSQNPMSPHIQCNQHQCNVSVPVNDIPVF